MTPDAPGSPTDLEPDSWLAIGKRAFSEFREDNLTDWAAALTYYAVLSIFPALIALVSVAGLVMDPQSLTDALTDLVGTLGPSSAVETFKGPIDEIANDKGTAGVFLVVGLALALWSASGWVGAFMRASNQIYETAEGRPFWKLRPLQMLVTLVLVLLLALVLVAVVVTGPVAEDVGGAIGAGDTAVTVWNIAKWPVLLAVVMLMFAILYYSAPNARLPKFRWITPGSVIGVVVWLLATAAFAVYVANFGSYNKTYGALGGVVTFLVWMWITNLAILFGQELNAEVERSRELVAGTPGAEHELQLPPREEPSAKQRPTTA
jgi:membrane protein